MFNNIIGKTINRYKIVSQLGSGGMGTVFKTRDLSLRRDVAIKIMHPVGYKNLIQTVLL